MKRAIVSLIVLFIVIGSAGLGVFGWGHGEFHAPGPLPRDTVVTIAPGKGVSAIAGRLHAEGVIADPLIFRLGVRITGNGTRLKAGEYEIPAGASAFQVMALLVDGRTVVRRFTLPEGATVKQALVLLADAEGLTGEMPAAGTVAEGSLLPETYHYARGDSYADLIGRMQKAMNETVAELWTARPENLPYTSREEAVILASIVERETGVAGERREVAGVFVNRLRKGMRLQSDPTVIYGLSDGLGVLDRPLLRRDWDARHPYNTYAIDGLPPTPIANPGRESLIAALNPAETENLYFVADGTGGHAFAKTLAEHNRNVAKWRRIRARQQGN